MREKDYDGQDWVLMDTGQELMILRKDGTAMVFRSKEVAENYLSANDGIPSSFLPVRVCEVSSHLAPSKMKN